MPISFRLEPSFSVRSYRSDVDCSSNADANGRGDNINKQRHLQ